MTKPTTPTSNTRHTALRFEPEAFRQYVQGMDITTSQQDALLEAVWLIVVGVVELAPEHHHFPEFLLRTQALEADSPSVLASDLTSDITNTKDAKASSETSARRTES